MLDTHKPQKLILKGKSSVYIDYGNVYGWGENINNLHLYKYLKSYPQIKSINFYYGLDNNQKSSNFLKNIKKYGYNLVTKPVKHITIDIDKKTSIRKCDFDIEISLSVFQHLKQDFQTFIFFSGDGDFCPLYQHLIELKKQVIVIYEQGHLGKEIWDLKNGLFKTRFSFLQVDKQK